MVSRYLLRAFVDLRPAYETLREVMIVNFLDEVWCGRLPFQPLSLPVFSFPEWLSFIVLPITKKVHKMDAALCRNVFGLSRRC